METDRKELERALRALKGAVSSRPGIPALTGVLIEGDGAGLATLTATDLETTAMARIGAGDGAGFRALVPFKILADTVKASTSERVGLERVDGHVNVAGASIRLLPEEDFPAIAEPTELVGAFDAAELRDMIGAVAPAASGDEARPVLTGIMLEVTEPGGASLVATDSYRLHIAELTNGAVRPGRYIIPERTASYVAKLIGRKPAAARVVVRCSESAVLFELGAVRLVVRLTDGEFPNWRQLIPDGEHDGDTVLTYDIAELEAALKAAEPFCGRDHVGGRPVRLRFGAGGIGLSASAPDLGDWSAMLARAEWMGPELTVAFTPTYLAGCVRAVGGGARMVLRDGLKPAVLTSADGRTRALVMPVRLPAPVVESEPAPEIHEPTADERAGGATVEDPTDPGPGEAGEPAEVEPEPVPTVYPGTEDDRRVIRKANDDEPEPEAPAEPEGRAEFVAKVEGLAETRDGRAHNREAAERIADFITAPSERKSVEPEPVKPEPVEDAAAQWAELADIGTVAGAGRSAVRVRVVVGPDGSPMVDARRFIDSPRYSGPTRKGFALRPAEAGSLAELLRDAQAAAEAL